MSIVSYITTSRRILIDSSTQSSAFVCHLKARNQHEFDSWLENLKQHRLYYQYKYTQQYTPQPSLRNAAIAAAPNQPVNAGAGNSAPSVNSNQTQMANSNNQVPNLIHATADGITLPSLNVIDDSNNLTLQQMRHPPKSTRFKNSRSLKMRHQHHAPPP